MKTVFIVCAVLAVLAMVLVMACCRVAGEDSRRVEENDPCDSCLRWGECNGVDENCPWRNKDGN